MGSYNNYLKSTHWQTIRKKVLRRAKGKCEKEGCQREATQVHHLTYERLGHEKLTDLQAICFPCHRNCHPDKDFSPPDPVDANHFECQFCPSHRADLYIGHSKLHFICCGCGESTWRYRHGRRKQMEEGKEKAEKNLTEEDCTCPICQKKLANPHGVKQHMEAKHDISSKENFVRPKCDECGRFFDRKHDLKQHYQAVHITRRPKKYPFRCVCGKNFNSYVDLRAHQRKGHV